MSKKKTNRARVIYDLLYAATMSNTYAYYLDSSLDRLRAEGRQLIKFAKTNDPSWSHAEFEKLCK